jgi:hypothetical protein
MHSACCGLNTGQKWIRRLHIGEHAAGMAVQVHNHHDKLSHHCCGPVHRDPGDEPAYETARYRRAEDPGNSGRRQAPVRNQFIVD